jgi:ABC-type Mn2+/Zn2+ transport system ATPase subunit
LSQPILIDFKGAALGYGGRPILTHVDLHVEAGSFWGVLGSNGSGKTTILKTFLSLIPPMGGRVTTRGRSGDSARFGYVPQKERLDPIYPLSGLDVASMGTWGRFELFKRLRGKIRNSFVRECLSECGATAFAAKPFSSLSGGQKQRVLIARALAAEPEILVLDEPLAGIDVPTQLALLDLLARVKKDRDLTVLMVSHRIRAEKTLFTNIAFVDEGKVVCGPAAKMISEGKLAEIFRGDL